MKKQNKTKIPCSKDILAQLLENPVSINTTIDNFFVTVGLAELIKKHHLCKRNGYKTEDILEYLLTCRFHGISHHRNETRPLVSGKCNYDAVCNLKKRQQPDWISFTTELSRKVYELNAPKEHVEDKDLRGGLFIIDDSPYKRDSSKKTELVSTQFDHSTMSTYKGFRWSALGYYNWGNYYPVNSIPVSSVHEDKILVPPAETFTETARQRRVLTQTKLPQLMLFQIDKALELGFEASYCLFDTWFCSKKMFYELLKRNLYGIGMVKTSPKVVFEVEGRSMNTKEIFEAHKYDLQQLKDGHSYFSLLAQATYNEETFEIKLCFYTSSSKNKDFVCLATTDTDLSDTTILSLYKIRWNIETYFSNSKDTRTLDSKRQSQALSLDSVYADLAITMLVYLLISNELAKAGQPLTFRDKFYEILLELSAVRILEFAVRCINHILKDISEYLDTDLSELINLSVDSLLGLKFFTDTLNRTSLSFFK